MKEFKGKEIDVTREDDGFTTIYLAGRISVFFDKKDWNVFKRDLRKILNNKDF